MNVAPSISESSLLCPGRASIRKKRDESFAFNGTPSTFDEPVQVTKIAHWVHLDVEEQFDICGWQDHRRAKIRRAFPCCQQFCARLQFFERRGANPCERRLSSHDEVGQIYCCKFPNRANPAHHRFALRTTQLRNQREIVTCLEALD